MSKYNFIKTSFIIEKKDILLISINFRLTNLRKEKEERIKFKSKILLYIYYISYIFGFLLILNIDKKLLIKNINLN